MPCPTTRILKLQKIVRSTLYPRFFSFIINIIRSDIITNRLIVFAFNSVNTFTKRERSTAHHAATKSTPLGTFDSTSKSTAIKILHAGIIEILLNEFLATFFGNVVGNLTNRRLHGASKHTFSHTCASFALGKNVRTSTDSASRTTSEKTADINSSVSKISCALRCIKSVSTDKTSLGICLKKRSARCSFIQLLRTFGNTLGHLERERSTEAHDVAKGKSLARVPASSINKTLGEVAATLKTALNSSHLTSRTNIEPARHGELTLLVLSSLLCLHLLIMIGKLILSCIHILDVICVGSAKALRKLEIAISVGNISSSNWLVVAGAKPNSLLPCCRTLNNTEISLHITKSRHIRPLS